MLPKSALEVGSLMVLLATMTSPSTVHAAPAAFQESVFPSGPEGRDAAVDFIDIEKTTSTVEQRELNTNHPALGYALMAIPAPADVVDGPPAPARAKSFASMGQTERTSLQALEQNLGRRFEKANDKLPKSGAVSQIPWPADYWPHFRDGINFKWDGPQSQSPTEKYALAFGIDPKRLSDTLSRTTGIDFVRTINQPTCTRDEDCARLRDGSVCAKREGQPSGVCTPQWFGVCHAWAPAAILEPEPKCPVTFNNVTFKVNDLKALVTQMYDGTNIGTIIGGGRCNEVNPATDANGRYRVRDCQDMTPDLFHLVVTNMLGGLNRSFVVDIDARQEVWNQPVRSYEIEQNKPVSLQEGAKLVNPRLNRYGFNTAAASLAHVVTRFDYIVESRQDGPLVPTGIVNNFTSSARYEYLLELDRAGTIIGGEWLGESKALHPDYIWLPLNRPSDEQTVAGGINYKNVKNLLNQSVNGTQC
ncbi:hypothetical protein HK102_011009 [Quaeritorhiza haematococci]|nr:hypothetical protein HK102_011009 [Quaeritorhiza haematococci]